MSLRGAGHRARPAPPARRPIAAGSAPALHPHWWRTRARQDPAARSPSHGGERHRLTPPHPPARPGLARPGRRDGTRVPARRAHVGSTSRSSAAPARPSYQRPTDVSLRTTRPKSPADRRRHRGRSAPPEPRPAAPPLPSAAAANRCPLPASQPIGIRRPVGAGQRIRRPGAGRLLGRRAGGTRQSLGGVWRGGGLSGAPSGRAVPAGTVPVPPASPRDPSRVPTGTGERRRVKLTPVQRALSARWTLTPDTWVLQ